MTIVAWGLFLLLVFALLAMDLGVFNKKLHEISTSEALRMTCIWIGCSFLFCGVVYAAYEYDWFNLLSSTADSSIKCGTDASLKYITGYLIEKALSLDNIFVMAMLFNYFKIPNKYQHEVLFWGILGALVFRGLMIVLGAALVNKFSWVMYIFGVVLMISALKMLFGKNEEFDADKSSVIKILRKFYPVSSTLDEGRFFTKIENGLKAVTPLFVTLLVIETTDILFAVDSIPAVFSVTTDSFVVFTSNIFAILGLRSLYFVLASLMNKFKYMEYSLVVLLLFIAVKMLLPILDIEIPIVITLIVIVAILTIGILASIAMNKKNDE